MGSKEELKNELVAMRRQLETLKGKEAELKQLSEAKGDQTSSQLFTLLKYMMDENKATRMLIQSIYDKLAKFEQEVDTDYAEETPQNAQARGDAPVAGPNAKIVPISDLDKRIIHHIQMTGMACADDVKKIMGYRGRNAASARLNRLYKEGILERYQLGHKVFYKYDVGKATDRVLLVSPN